MYKKTSLNRMSAVVLTVVMILSSITMVHAAQYDYAPGQGHIGASPAYVGIAPLVTFFTHMETSVDETQKKCGTREVDAGDVINVTVWWMRGGAVSADEPIAVWTTNGATINTKSITAESNGVPIGVTDIVLSDDVLRVAGNSVLRFRTSTPISPWAFNSVSFDVTAPQSADAFEVSVKVGREDTPDSDDNFRAVTFAVNTTMSVTTSVGSVENNAPFNVYVVTDFPLGLMVTVQLIHEETGVVYIDRVGTLDADGNFTYTGFAFPDDAPEGAYFVSVMIFGLDFSQLPPVPVEWGMHDTTRITLVRPLPTGAITVSAPATVNGSESFSVNGNVTTDYAAPRVAWKILNPLGGLVFFGTEYPCAAGEFEIEGINFIASTHPAGSYTVNVLLQTANGGEMDNASRSIQLNWPPPSTITVNAPPTIHGPGTFEITGNVTTYYQNARIMWELICPFGSTMLDGAITAPVTGSYRYGWITFPSNSPTGDYTIRVTLLRTNNTVLATNSRTIHRTMSVSFDLTGPNSVTGNASFTVHGQVTYPFNPTGLIAHWEINRPGTGTPTLRSGRVPVNANGTFAVTTSFPASAPADFYVVDVTLRNAGGTWFAMRNHLIQLRR